MHVVFLFLCVTPHPTPTPPSLSLWLQSSLSVSVSPSSTATSSSLAGTWGQLTEDSDMVWTGGQLVEIDCLIDGLMNKAIGPFHGENNWVTFGSTMTKHWTYSNFNCISSSFLSNFLSLQDSSLIHPLRTLWRLNKWIRHFFFFTLHVLWCHRDCPPQLLRLLSPE